MQTTARTIMAGIMLNATPAPGAPFYDLELALDPAASRLAVTATISGVPCRGDTLRVHLNRSLTITEAQVDGRAVTPVLDPPGAPQFWLSAARAIDLPCPQRSARLRYAGPGTLTPDGRNQVSPRLVELSLYGGWFPLATIDQRNDWRLRTRLPACWTFASPGRGATRPALDLRSATPSDIVLVAGPDFVETRVAGGAGSARVLIAATAPPAARAAALGLGREAAATAAWLAEVLGPAPGAGRPELIFTPRGGPLSYARLPLIITPEATLTNPGGRDLALNIRHETAHFWARGAASADDWINEGVAEYLAVVRTGDAEGAAARTTIVAGYARDVAAAGAGTPIGAGIDDDRGFINRYQRPVLLFDAIERRTGRPAVEAWLRRTLALTPAPTTSAMIATADADTAALLRSCLAARDWPAACGGSAAADATAPALPQ